VNGHSADTGSAILKAQEIVKSLFLEKPADIDITAIAVERGAFAKEESLKGADGRLTVLGNRGMITVRADIPESEKKRFVIAHELGHFELHREKFATLSCSDVDFYQWSQSKPLEVEANHFASEILMPEPIFKKRIKGKKLSKGLLLSLATEFQTSLTATAIRWLAFETDYALVVSRSSTITWFIRGRDFPFFISTAGKVHPESLAYDFFKERDLPDDFFPVSGIGWVDDPRMKHKEIMELAIPLPAYDEVLSFLHADLW
jgi:hypothetical protein